MKLADKTHLKNNLLCISTCVANHFVKDCLMESVISLFLVEVVSS